MPQPDVVVDGRRCRFDDVLDAVPHGVDGVELALGAPGEVTLTAIDGTVLRVQDGDGVLTRWLGDASASAVRIRPDRIVRAALPLR